MKALLSIGSNLQNAYEYVAEAILFLKSSFNVKKCSDIYFTPEINGKQQLYANAVLLLDTSLSCEELDLLLKNYEVEKGRTNECRVQNIVPIDLDIVIYNETILRPRDYSAQFFQIGFKELQ